MAISSLLPAVPALFKNLAVKLLCRSGRTIHNSPKAPSAPAMILMISKFAKKNF